MKIGSNLEIEFKDPYKFCVNYGFFEITVKNNIDEYSRFSIDRMDAIKLRDYLNEYTK